MAMYIVLDKEPVLAWSAGVKLPYVSTLPDKRQSCTITINVLLAKYFASMKQLAKDPQQQWQKHLIFTWLYQIITEINRTILFIDLLNTH